MAVETGDEPWHPVRSIYLALPEERVQEHVTSRSTGLADAAFVSEAGLLIAEADDGGEIAMAIQPIEAEKTALHLSTTIADPEARVALARKLLRLRNDLEGLCGRGS